MRFRAVPCPPMELKLYRKTQYLWINSGAAQARDWQMGNIVPLRNQIIPRMSWNLSKTRRINERAFLIGVYDLTHFLPLLKIIRNTSSRNCPFATDTADTAGSSASRNGLISNKAVDLKNLRVIIRSKLSKMWMAKTWHLLCNNAPKRRVRFVKVKVSLCKPWKQWGGVEAKFYAWLTWAPDGGEWPTSRHGRFYPGKGALGNNLTGSWQDSWAGVDALDESILPLPGIEPCYCKDSPPNVLSRSRTVGIPWTKDCNFKSTEQVQVSSEIPCKWYCVVAFIYASHKTVKKHTC